MASSKATYGIRDKHHHGKVWDFLVEKVSDGSALSVVSAYFTFYAYEAMSERLDRSRTYYTLLAPEEHVGRDSVQATLPLEGGKRGGEGGNRDAQGGNRTLPDLPTELSARLPKSGQRVSAAGLRQLIQDLCGWQALRGEELATLLKKDLKYLRNKHLIEMVQAGELAFLYPESPNHALQAYLLPGRGEADMSLLGSNPER